MQESDKDQETVSPVATGQKQYVRLNPREMHTEIQRRTKLLYGQQNLIHLLKKSEESMKLFEHDIWFSIETDDEGAADNNAGPVTEAQATSSFSMRDLLKTENFIIPMDAQWKNVFDSIVLVLTTWSCISMMFIVCFNQEMSETLTHIDLVVTVFFALDFIFNFFQEYPDRETFQRIRNHYKIAMRYLRGMAIFDFLATFPFDVFVGDDGAAARLIRLTRLTKLMNILDPGRCKRAVKAYYDSSTRSDRMQQQYIVMYTVKVLRLIIIVVMITYFLGCVWFLLVRSVINFNSDHETRNTFITYHDFDQMFLEGTDNQCYRQYCSTDPNVALNGATVSETDICLTEEWQTPNCKINRFTQLVIVCYFALTTLSTVGYGDLYPVSIPELLLGIVFMLVGIVFFSQMMGSFIDIIKNYNDRIGGDEEESDLNLWLQRLTRFTNDNRPLQKELINQIDSHFTFANQPLNNRLKAIQKEQEYLHQVPKVVKHYILLSYLFDDIIYRFRSFFQIDHVNSSSCFLYDVCFGLKPAKFDPTMNNDTLIFDEEDEVSEMYFILQGSVGVCHYMMTQGLSKRQISTGIKYEKPTYICDFYVCHNQRSEFIYQAEGTQNVSGFSLAKQFLLKEIFPKYKKIAMQIKDTSEKRYNKNIRRVMNDLRNRHIIEINKQSPYKKIQVVERMPGQSRDDASNIVGGTKNFRRSEGMSNLSQRGKQLGEGVDGSVRSSAHPGVQRPMTDNGETPTGAQAPTSGNENLGISSSETDISVILRSRLAKIDNEIEDYDQILKDFSITVDSHLKNFTVTMGKLQVNLNKVNQRKIQEDSFPN